MREFMAMVLSAQLFVMCISAAMWFFGTELAAGGAMAPTSSGSNQVFNRSLNLTDIGQNVTARVQTYQTDPFNALFIFGDFGRAVTDFFYIVSGGYVFSMMGLFGFPQSFIVGVQIVFSLGALFTAVYLISGRG